MLSDFRQHKLARLFAAFDADHDGILTNEDPKVIMANLAALVGIELGSPPFELFQQAFMAYWKDFVMSSDADGDGRVTLDEWVQYHDEMLQDEARFRSTAGTSAAVMFGLVDTDHDGFISMDEYGAWLRAWQHDPAEVTPELLGRLDVDGTGKLSNDGLLQLTREFFYSDDPQARGNWCMGPL